MESRRKWKIRYYRERKRRKEEVEQLETKEQKLIEKLEEDINNSERGKDTNILLIKEYYKNKAEYAQEILEILKGEKE